MPSAVFASASVFGRSFGAALETVRDRVSEKLAGPADVAFLFVSAEYAQETDAAPARVRAALGGPRLLGCTGAGVCETAGESEEVPGVALLAARVPGATFLPFTLRQEALAQDGGADAIREIVGLDDAATPSFVLLADPYSTDPERLLRRLEEAYPAAPASGGLASGGHGPGAHRLFLDDRSVTQGAVGLAVTGMKMRTVVSQGCRPVGRRRVVTKLREGRVLGLSGEPALDVVEQELAAMTPADRELARTNLLVGRAAHEAREEFGRGDFLVRNLAGIVPSERSLVIGDRLRLGQTVQLQLRDRATAEEDLDLLLDAARSLGEARGGLLFTCGGRGTRLFGRSSADVLAVRKRFGDLPLAGFACGGEFGPIGGRNFVHGFTASLALL